MRILFVNRTFPGHFGPLAAALAQHPDTEVRFVSGHGRQGFSLPGVRHVVVRFAAEPRHHAQPGQGAPLNPERLLAAGRQALVCLRRVREQFEPDMVVTASLREHGLFLREAFPESFLVCCADPVRLSPDGVGADVPRCLLHSLEVLECDLCVTLTAGEESPYAGRLVNAAALPYPVDTEFFSQERAAPAELDGVRLPADKGRVILFSIRHEARLDTLLHTVRALLEAEPDDRAVLLCGSGVNRARLQEALRGNAVSPRLHVVDRLSLEAYRDLLCASALLVLREKGDVPPPVLLEAMSCGAVPMLPATAVRSPLLRHNETVFCCDGDPALTDPAAFPLRGPLAETVRRNARATVLRHFRRQDVVPGHAAFLLKAWQRHRDAAHP